MTKTVEAVYENGVLRPLRPIKGLKKNQRVDITVATVTKKKHPLHGLCGIMPNADAAEMLKTVENEFEKVDTMGARQYRIFVLGEIFDRDFST